MREESILVTMDDVTTPVRTTSLTILPITDDLQINTTILPLQLFYDPQYPEKENKLYCWRVFNIWWNTELRKKKIKLLSYCIPARLEALVSMANDSVLSSFAYERVDLMNIFEFIRDKRKYEATPIGRNSYAKWCEYLDLPPMGERPAAMAKAIRHLEMYKNLFNMIHVKEIND